MDGPGDGDDGAGVGDGGGEGDGPVILLDAAGLVTAGDIVEGHGSEDGGEDHAGGVDPDEVFVDFDAAAGGT